MRRIAALLAAAALLCLPCAAAGLAAEAQAFGAEEAERALPESAREHLGDAAVEDAADAAGLLSRLWKSAGEKAGEIAHRGLRSALSILAAALLCGLFSALAEGGEASRYAVLGGALGVALIAAGDAGAFIAAGAGAVEELSDFSRALLPCMTAAASAGGAVTSAAVKYAATSLFMELLLTFARTLALPLVYGYMAASVAAAALDSPALDSAAALMKWLCVSVMTLLTTAFTLYLTTAGAVTGASDALAAKAAKTAISAALPVVGGIVANAASAVVAGAGLVRGAVGVFGLCSVLAVCITPFLRLGIQYLLYKAVAVLASAFAEKRIGALIGALGDAFGMVLGLAGSGAVMLFFSIMSLLRTVTA